MTVTECLQSLMTNSSTFTSLEFELTTARLLILCDKTQGKLVN